MPAALSVDAMFGFGAKKICVSPDSLLAVHGGKRTADGSPAILCAHSVTQGPKWCIGANNGSCRGAKCASMTRDFVKLNPFAGMLESCRLMRRLAGRLQAGIDDNTECTQCSP